MKDSSILVNDYINTADWRVKENSTVAYSLGGLILSNSGAVTADYWLNQVYDKEIADAHRNCDMHIHDLSMLSGYCAGWNLKQLIEEGLGGVPGKIASSPASHLSTLCNQMVNFLGILQNEWAGAQAFSSFDTYLAPFVKADNLSYKEVKQAIQSFVFGVNTPSRWGSQAPFTNVTLDWTVPADLKDMPAIVGGKEQNFTYGDCKREMDMVNKAFMEIMIEGDANGRGFQYPIPTYSITKDFDWSETENNKMLFEMTAKYGTPYFSNYINSDMEPSDVRSMCPMTGDTKVFVRNKATGKIRIDEIRIIYQTSVNHKTCEYQVWTNDGWKDCKPVRVPMTEVYKLTFSNGASVKLGENHLQPTKDFGTLHADELQVGMWIPFNKKAFGTEMGDRDLGYIVGAYAEDGSKNGSGIIYSLDSAEKDDITIEKLTSIWNRLGFPVVVTPGERNVRFLRVNENAYDVVREYIFGENALTKGFTNRTFNSSVEFKRGILEGMRDTDGCRDRKRFYTSSSTLREHLCVLLSSIGHKYTCNYVDEREGRLGTNPNYRIDCPDRPRYGELYDEDENYFYYKIVKMEKVETKADYLYCFEVDSNDHLFSIANGMVTHNCRLRLDLRELRRKGGGFFGSGESTGSVGVVTINLPRIAYLAKDEEDFFFRLDSIMNIAARSLKIKRDFVTKQMEKGLYPYTKRYLGTFDNHFSTIATVGGNEMCLNAKWLGQGLTTEEGRTFMVKVLNHMREKLSDYQEIYGDLYNLEAAPAESTSYRLAKHDKEKFKNIITANMNGIPYYTNSSQLPVGYTEDVFSALDMQDEIQTLYTSGTVFHTFLGEKLPTWKSAMKLVRSIAENYKLPYYTISPTYSICPEHGYLIGEASVCPNCGKPTEVYSRITGYYRPIQNWNDGKKQEFRDRLEYDVKTSFKKHPDRNGVKEQK